MKKINIKFSGYKWDNYPFPNVNGLYGIYTTKKNFKGENIVEDLVYVGISNNIDRRIKNILLRIFQIKISIVISIQNYLKLIQNLQKPQLFQNASPRKTMNM